MVAQKPSGRVIPAASPLQLAAAAWVGSVADHDISSITSATRRRRPPNHRTIEPIEGKYVNSIVHLYVVQTAVRGSKPPSISAQTPTATFFPRCSSRFRRAK